MAATRPSGGCAIGSFFMATNIAFHDSNSAAASASTASTASSASASPGVAVPSSTACMRSVSRSGVISMHLLVVDQQTEALARLEEA